MSRRIAQNVVTILQRDELSYRHFGWTWWFVKRQLKKFGFGPEHLRHLGPYDIPDCDPLYAEFADDAGLWDEALRVQYTQAVSRWHDPNGFRPDGESYLVFDGDVE